MYHSNSRVRRAMIGGTLFIAILLLGGCASQPVSTATPAAAPTVARVPTSEPPNNSTTQLFDGHLHYSEGAWAGYPVSSIQEILDRAGIKRALVSSTPNEGTLRLYQADPARFVPELRPYRTREDMTQWFRDPTIVPFIEEELKRGVYRGIGEFHLNGADATTPIVKRIADLAAERNLPLHAHSDEMAIEALFAANPRVTVLWAHAGMSTPVETLGRVIERYPNLWVELSYRYDIVQDGKLDPAWRALFERFPDRFVYGTDTWTESRWEQVPGLAATARGWLAELPANIAAKIASQNFQALFGQ